MESRDACIGAQKTAYNLCFKEWRECPCSLLFNCVVFFPIFKQRVADAPAALPSAQKLVAHFLVHAEMKHKNKMQKKGGYACLQGGFSTAEQATQSWMLKLSEWATQPLAGSWGHKYQAGGLNIGGSMFDTLFYLPGFSHV